MYDKILGSPQDTWKRLQHTPLHLKQATGSPQPPYDVEIKESSRGNELQDDTTEQQYVGKKIIEELKYALQQMSPPSYSAGKTKAGSPVLRRSSRNYEKSKGTNDEALSEQRG